MSRPEDMVNVRYMVDDVQTAVGFYTGNVVERFEPATTTPGR